MKAYHVTTPRKVERYAATGGILPPVRYWPTRELAEKWAKRTGRGVLAVFDTTGLQTHPLPDHRPARFTPDFVPLAKVEFEEIRRKRW